jgi:hypothetical protein
MRASDPVPTLNQKKKPIWESLAIHSNLIPLQKNGKESLDRWRIPRLTNAAQFNRANLNTLSQGTDSEEGRWSSARTLESDLIGALPIFACHHSKYHLTAAMTDHFKCAGTFAHAASLEIVQPLKL